jgi:CheY-like chemotaxis protein
MLSVALSERKATVETVASVDEALEALARFRPDAIVSDLAMPEQDGYAFIRQLRARDAAAGGRTPAIALTAYTRIEDRARALAAGYSMFVGKPVEPRELVRVIASLIEPSGRA